MPLPVVALVKPSDIEGLTPQQIGPCHLSEVFFPGVGHDSLHRLAARAWVALAIAALAAGKWTLTCAGWGSALRPFPVQEKAFLERYRPGPYNPLKHQLKHQRVYKGVRYYLLKNQIPCAVPGTGNHPLGLAVDGALLINGKIHAWSTNPAFWKWLKANVVRFGFSFEHPDEGVDDPHIRYVAGDRVPQAVLDVEAWIEAHK